MHIKSFIENKLSKQVRILSIVVILLAGIILGYNVFASNDYPMTVTYSPNMTVGSEGEAVITIENQTDDQTVKQTYISVTIPESVFTLIDDSVYVSVNDGEKQRAISSDKSKVLEGDIYRYSYKEGSNNSYTLYISMCTINPGDKVSVSFSFIAQSEGNYQLYYLARQDGESGKYLSQVAKVSQILLGPVVKPVVEKTSTNLDIDEKDEEENPIAYVGNTIEYKITATNNTSTEDSLWKDVEVSDTLPEGISFVHDSVYINQVKSDEYKYDEDTRTLTVKVGDLAGGDTAEVVFRATVNDDAYGKEIKNTATVTGVDQYWENENDDEKKKVVEEPEDEKEYKIDTAVTIEFDANNDKASGEMANQIAEYNVTTTLNENQFSLEGYNFLGWSEDPNEDEPEYRDKQSITPTGNMKLYAVWSIGECTINFYANADDAEGEMEPQVVNEFEYVTLNENAFTRPGYTFAGWSETEDGEIKYKDMERIQVGSTNINLYAVWSKDYTITFDKNAADASGQMSAQTVTSAITVTLNKNEFTRSGYTFLGWSEDSSATKETYRDQEAGITVTKDMRLYAVWERSEYTITFDKNAADASGQMSAQTVTSAITVTLNKNEFTRSGYTFLGWSEDSSATKETYKDQEAGITVTKDMRLYAVWESTAPDVCTITFDKNNDEGAEGTMAAQTANVGDTVTLNANEFIGLHVGNVQYNFKGWSYSPDTKYDDDDNIIEDQGSITVSSNTTLYAVWYKVGIDPGNPHIPYLTGYDDGSVRIEQNILRSEAAAIFYRLLDEEVHTDKYDSVKNYFNDIKVTDWFYEEVNYLAKNGVLNGYEDGKFRPNDPITRAEFAKIASIFDQLELTDENVFSDLDSDHWAVKYINSAYIKGWVTGDGDGTYRPLDNIKRSEVVTVVNRMTNRSVDPDAMERIMNPYNDIAVTDWYYKDVLEASIEHWCKVDENGNAVLDEDGNEIWEWWIIDGEKIYK